MTIPLNSRDAMFTLLRDLNFSAVPSLLRKKATEIKDVKGEVGRSQTLQEIRQLTSKITGLMPHQRTLFTHISFAERMQKITNEANFRSLIAAEQNELNGNGSSAELTSQLMDKHDPYIKTLRLTCIRCLANGGLPQKDFDTTRELFLHTYGYEHIFSLYNLEKAGLLFASSPKAVPFRSLAKQFHLLNPSVDVHAQQHLSYAYTGYCPLLVRYVERALTPVWIDQLEALNALPGGDAFAFQSTPARETLPNARPPSIVFSSAPSLSISGASPPPSPATTATSSSDSSGQTSTRPLPTVLVFLGGVTYGEIAALRLLAKQPNVGPIIIVTTRVITGNRFIGALIHSKFDTLAEWTLV